MEHPLTEETNMDDAMERTARKTTEETSHLTRHLVEGTERAAKANVDMMTDQAKALRDLWQAGTEMASQLTARSADEVGRVLGIGGDEAEKAADHVSGNIGAVAQSANVVARGARAMSREWVDLVRHSTERSLDHVGAMMRCRSPQELVTVQTDLLRDNVEALMDGTRRIAEIALRTADDASRHVNGKGA